jgi:predicted transcriptional regulator
MTKAVAVALDIAGRPDTDDAYALNSVRKAYSLLNGATFQDLVEGHDNAPAPTNYGIDWLEAYRLEAAKAEALTKELERLKADLPTTREGPSSGVAQRRYALRSEKEESRASSQQTKRTRAKILATLAVGDQTVTELSRSTSLHSRTLQRRLKELVADGTVQQANSGVSPVYGLVSAPPTFTPSMFDQSGRIDDWAVDT